MKRRVQTRLDWLNGDIRDLRRDYERLYRVDDPGRFRWDTVDRLGRRLRTLIQEPARPPGDAAMIVYFHGGGWIVGSPATHADISRALCEGTGLAVVSVDYRLAPEYPAPAPVEDGLAALEHAIGESGAHAVLCGDSAGAAIALAVERRADGRLREAIAGVCGFYGCFGILDSASLRRRGSRDEGLDETCLRRMWHMANPPDVQSPYAVDSLAGPSDVPTYLLAAAEDPILDDTLALAEAYEGCGRRYVLDLVEGQSHGFLHRGADPHAASRAVARVSAWIGERVRTQRRYSR